MFPRPMATPIIAKINVKVESHCPYSSISQCLLFNVLKYIGYDKELNIEDAAGFPIQDAYKIYYNDEFNYFDEHDFIGSTSLYFIFNNKLQMTKYINIFFKKNEPFYFRSSFINICTRHKTFYENDNFEINFNYEIVNNKYEYINILLYGLLILDQYNDTIDNVIT